MKRKIHFLGHIIENGRILPSSEKTRAVEKFPIPSSKKEIQRFLGLTSFFRRFVRNYAVVAKPLTDLLKKDATFVLTDEHFISIQELKNALVNAPALKLYNPTAYTEVHADASKYGYGAVLLQKDGEDQQLHPIEYMSRKTTSTEEKYSSYELEVLAVIEAVKKWRIYLRDLKFKIVTDCNAFALTMSKRDVTDRVMRWAMYLQEYDYTVEHRAGTRMKHVDALSRVYCLIIEDSLKFRLREAQAEDEWIRAVKKVLEKEQYEDYFLRNEVLYKDPVKEFLVVPSSMEDEIIRLAHNQGHFATKKTQDMVEKFYFIPKLSTKVSKIIKSCVECIVIEAKAGKKEGLLNPIDKACEPLGTYHIDHVGPLAETRKKYNHILAVIDGFTKFVWLYPTKSTGVEEVIDRLKKQCAVFGNPKRVITDRGSAFTSTAFKAYCEQESIQHLQIATGVPRGNGQVERVHKIVVPMISKLCHSDPAHWYSHVGKVQQILNSTAPRSTKASPFKVLTGLEMRRIDYPDLREIYDELTIEDLNLERNTVRRSSRKHK